MAQHHTWVSYQSWCAGRMSSGNKSCLLPGEIHFDIKYYMASNFLETNHRRFLSSLYLLRRYSVGPFPRDFASPLSSSHPGPSVRSPLPFLCQSLEPLGQFSAHVCQICGSFANIAWLLQQYNFAFAVPYVPTRPSWMLAHWQFCLPLHTLQFGLGKCLLNLSAATSLTIHPSTRLAETSLGWLALELDDKEPIHNLNRWVVRSVVSNLAQ